MSTSVASVVSHFPSAENGFTTTTSGSVSSGATTVGLNSVAGYSNGEIAVFVIDPDDTSKKQTFTGTIDTAGVQVTSVVWTAGTNQTHASGATVVDYATATHISMISKGILVHADQDGTLKAGAVDSAGVLASDVVTTAKILDSNVTAAKLATSALYLGSASITSDFTSTATPAATNITGLSAAVTVPAGGRVVKISVGGYYMSSSAAAGTGVELQIYDNTAGAVIGSLAITSPDSSYALNPYFSTFHTPAAGARTYLARFIQGAAGTFTFKGSATTPGYILVEAV